MARLHRLANAIPYIASLVFILLGAYRIQFPGIQYDEALFIQPALGAEETLFLHHHWNGIPIMLMEYIGALKAWVYAPIFHFFGVSPFTVRFPMILVAAATLLFLCRFIRRESGPAAAAFLAILLAVDPAFIFHTRMDWGPFALRMFLKSAAILVWFRFVRSPSLGSLLGVGLLLAIGMWDKLNFIWFVAGFGLATLLCYFPAYMEVWRRTKPLPKYTTILLTTAALAALKLLGMKHGEDASEMASWNRLGELVISAFHALNADSLTTFLVTHPMRFPGIQRSLVAAEVLAANPMLASIAPIAAFSACTVACLLLFPFLAKTARARNGRLLLFFLIIGVVTILFILVTPGAGGLHKSHHMMALFPYYLVLGALLFQSGVDAWNTRTGKAVAIAMGLTGLVLAVGGAAHTVRILRYVTTDQPLDARWSPRIYDLADYLNREGRDADLIISVDWGTHNTLHAFVDPDLRPRMADCWLDFKRAHNEEGGRQRIAELVRSKQRVLVVAYDDREGVQQIARLNFELAMRHAGLMPVLIHTIDQEGRIYFKVFEVRPRPEEPSLTAPAG